MKKAKIIGFLAIWIAVIVFVCSIQAYKKSRPPENGTTSSIPVDDDNGDNKNSPQEESIDVDKWIDEAAATFEKENDHTAAVAVLRRRIDEANSIGDVSAVERIENEISEYAAFEPVSLASLVPVQDPGHVSSGGYYTKDVNGDTHEDPLYMNGAWYASDDNVYLMYNLNYEYSRFSGTVYRTYESLSCTEWAYSPYVKIYGDGILLWESPTITLDTYDTIDFDVDVSGVRNMKIFVAGEGPWDPWICVGDTKLQK